MRSVCLRKAWRPLSRTRCLAACWKKKFADVLQEFINQQHGQWDQTIIRGNLGFRFSLPEADRLWELELQPKLGIDQGVMIQSQPDFILRCDDDRIKPIAIFTHGFQYHCHPENRIADDMRKRCADPGQRQVSCLEHHMG